MSLCVQHRRCGACGVAGQFLLNTLSLLKARLIGFWRDNHDIKRAIAMVTFSVPRLEWPGEGNYLNLTRINTGSLKCGHSSSYPLTWHPPGDHNWET